MEDHYHLDRSCRNAAYMLIRLTFVNCCKHAVIRWRDQRHTTSAATLCTAALRQVDQATLPD